jgi:hypothetical protein
MDRVPDQRDIRFDICHPDYNPLDHRTDTQAKISQKKSGLRTGSWFGILSCISICSDHDQFVLIWQIIGKQESEKSLKKISLMNLHHANFKSSRTLKRSEHGRSRSGTMNCSPLI